jgi:hypothetical protein
MVPKMKFLFISFLLVTLIASTLACSLSQAQTATQAPAAPGATSLPPAASAPPTEMVVPATETLAPVVHSLTPGDPPGGFESQIRDADTSTVAAQRRASAGENYMFNLFERPFDQSMNTYFPDLDLKNAGLKRSAPWTYVTLTLQGQNPQGGLKQTYGVELDINMDGRGDFLILAAAPAAAWSTDGVRVWKDGNHDVGGVHPVQSDPPPQTGDGYETLLVDSGRGTDPDLAWARISPANPNLVQIAFKSSLYNDANKFLWGGWAIAPEMVHPDWFDYNDHFTQADAGSPLVELTQYYPLKALYSIDDTCRWGVGFTPTGSEPGVCPVPPTPTPVLPGTISGIVFNDGVNGDLVLDSHSIRLMGAYVHAAAGSCSSPGAVVDTKLTNANGLYKLTVPPGTYCVYVSPDPVGYSHKTPPTTVTVGNGGAVNDINFGYEQYLG